MRSSFEIAQQHRLTPIETIGERLGLLPDEVEPYGRYEAKVSLSVLDRLKDAPDAKLVCVVGVTPTREGEGNTTTLVGLTDALAAIGRRPVACLREGSVGRGPSAPCLERRAAPQAVATLRSCRWRI